VSGGVPPGFQWDEDKNQANIAKHGIDFRDAARVFEMPMLDRVDDRKNYVEVRVNSPGVLAGRIIANVTHTDRDGQIRLISARLANEDQRQAYLEFQPAWRRSSGRGSW
jgi:uncharacterized DUF497 family protein